MRGHLRRRGARSWAIVLELPRGPDGRRRQKWHAVKGTKAQAERQLAKLLNDVNMGVYAEPSRETVGAYLERWLKDDASGSVAPKSFERYAEIVRSNLIPAFGHLRLSDLKPLQIQAMYSDLLQTGRKDGRGGLSKRTVVHIHRVLRKALAQAVQWQLLARNPADAVKPPKPDRAPMKVYDEAETARLLKAAEGSRLAAPVAVAATTGLRRGELLALAWRDVDLEGGALVVRRSVEQTKGRLAFKGAKTRAGMRKISLLPLTRDVLRAHLAAQREARLGWGPAYQDQDLVFPREDGSIWPPDHFSARFAKLVRASGLPAIRFHDLRHTHATHLLRQGVHPKIVSERLGHAGVAITLDTYSHVLPGMQEDAALQLDRALRRAMEGADAE